MRRILGVVCLCAVGMMADGTEGRYAPSGAAAVTVEAVEPVVSVAEAVAVVEADSIERILATRDFSKESVLTVLQKCCEYDYDSGIEGTKGKIIDLVRQLVVPSVSLVDVIDWETKQESGLYGLETGCIRARTPGGKVALLLSDGEVVMLRSSYQNLREGRKIARDKKWFAQFLKDDVDSGKLVSYHGKLSAYNCVERLYDYRQDIWAKDKVREYNARIETQLMGAVLEYKKLSAYLFDFVRWCAQNGVLLPPGIVFPQDAMSPVTASSPDARGPGINPAYARPTGRFFYKIEQPYWQTLLERWDEVQWSVSAASVEVL